MRVDVRGAADHLGLTPYAIRKAVLKGMPYYSTGGGKFIFDTEMINEWLTDEMAKPFESCTTRKPFGKVENRLVERGKRSSRRFGG